MSTRARTSILVEPLATMVQCIVPSLSPVSARALNALIESRGIFLAANGFARSLGLRNRDQLRRILASDHLPCLEDLAGWIRVLGWTLEAERSGVALSASVLNEGKEPGSCYRTVKRLTGRSWGEVRACGSHWVLIQFAASLETPKRNQSLITNLSDSYRARGELTQSA